MSKFIQTFSVGRVGKKKEEVQKNREISTVTTIAGDEPLFGANSF